MTNNTQTCTFVVEMEDDLGRFWSPAMQEGEVSAYIDTLVNVGYFLSDVDHTGAGCFGNCSDPL